MNRKYLDMSLLDALKAEPAVLKALESVPELSEKVGDVLGRNPSAHTAFERMPLNAMLTGIAEGDDGGRVGVYGRSIANVGLYGSSKDDVGVYGRGGRLAALFEGDVEVTGNLCCPNADFAEDFVIAGSESVEPGTVMVLGDEGVLLPSTLPYDKRVAGVLSGAGAYRAGIVLDRQKGKAGRSPLALLGKVFCKVDARYGAIDVGDMLTTSETPGHAMKAADPARAFGAVIGKALRPLRDGQELLPILIALQ